jgi:anhydro-N-acetylmuramic acid kinase
MLIKHLHILGLTGGASLNGLKAEIVSTDGMDVFASSCFRFIPYPEPLRDLLHRISGKKTDNPEYKGLIQSAEDLFSDFLYPIVKEYMTQAESPLDAVALEGPTVCHDPAQHYTYQLGKGRLLAERTGCKVISHFHNADLLNGGLGAPITATYYAALAQKLNKPVVFINLGGITTLTFIGTLGELIAFDSGAGTALIDDWMIKHGGAAMDYNGKCAALGKADEKIVATLMKHRYLAAYPPKCLKRDAFNDKIEHLEGLTLEDGAATATAFVAESVAYSIGFYLPEIPVTAVLCGGGTQNATLVRAVRQDLKQMHIETCTAKELNLNVNEAQAFAFLAARRLYALPITFPTTTGVPVPMTGGEIYEKES